MARRRLAIRRFDMIVVALDPTLGSEIRKARPCLVVSPDEMNRHLNTLIVAPMTTRGQDYPTRVPIVFQGKDGQIVLDQIRTVDKVRLGKRIGRLDPPFRSQVLQGLQSMFAP
jgi:mRNA interferase MazF